MSSHSPLRRIAAAAAAVAVATTLLSFPCAAQSLSVVRQADLSFGNVVAGMSGRVMYTEAGAAAFFVSALNFPGTQTVEITLGLPADIRNGVDSVPVTFGANDAAWSYTNNPATATSFDPAVGIDVSKNGNPTEIYVWIGASITTDTVTPKQPYSETLTLNARLH